MQKETTGTDFLTTTLSIDPLAEAERLLGNVREDGERVLTPEGLKLALNLNVARRAALSANFDTSFSNTLEVYQKVVDDIGFKIALVKVFPVLDRHERLFVYWHDSGILLTFTTYSYVDEDTDQLRYQINGGRLSYIWKSHTRLILANRLPNCPLSSGGIYSWSDDDRTWRKNPSSLPQEEEVWVGYDDCREALRHKIRRLHQLGTFKPEWKYNLGKHLSGAFLTSADYEDCEHIEYPVKLEFLKQREREVIETLPTWLQNKINMSL